MIDQTPTTAIVRTYMLIEQLGFLGILRVALEERLAEGAFDRSLSRAHAFEKVEPQLPTHVPGGEQHPGAL